MLYSSCIRLVPLSAFVGVGGRSAITCHTVSNSPTFCNVVGQCRNYARQAIRSVRPRTWRDILKTPATETPFLGGRLFLAAASGLGLGALCYYGLGLSNEVGAIDRAALWPQFVRERVHNTYWYLGGSLALTAASTVVIARTPALMNLFLRTGWLSLLGTIAAMIGTGVLCQSLQYEPGRFNVKHLAWFLHCGVMGGVIAPLTLLGGPLLLKAAVYTAGVVGGLSALAACAPSEKFLYMGGALAIGFGVVFASCIGSLFLPPTTALGAGLYSIAMYGGLVLFSAFLLYDTQRVIRSAEHYPNMAVRPFDPLNACLSIYVDTLNIFIRIAMLMSGNRRK